MALRRINITIKGLRPYIQHRRPSSEKEAKESSEVTKILQKNPWDEKNRMKEAELGLYTNSKGPYLPADHIHEALTKAGTTVQVKGQGKKTYRDIMRSYIFVDPEEIPLTPKKWIVDNRFVRIQRSGIQRNRPMFKEWGAEFELVLTDDSIPIDVVKECLTTAGQRIGIGDYRPRYGLFEISQFVEKT